MPAGLPPGGRLQFDVTSNIQGCNLPDTATIGLTQVCGEVGGICQGTQSGQVSFVKGPTSLLSANVQDANIPLCGKGQVLLATKNTSAAADLFDFVITERITDATFVVGSASAIVKDVTGATIIGDPTPIAFPPAVSTAVGSQVLEWAFDAYTPGSDQQKILELREASDTIFITYEIQTSCDSRAAQIAAQVEAEDVCDVHIAQSQGSVGLLTDLPELVVDKTARNESDPSGNTAPGSPNLIYASAGDTVAFRYCGLQSGRCRCHQSLRHRYPAQQHCRAVECQPGRQYQRTQCRLG